MGNKSHLAALLFVFLLAAGALGADEKAAIDAYKKAMKSDKERERIAAVCALAEVPGKKTTGLLRKAVRSDHFERVQAAAALALSRRGDPKDLRYLLGCLRSLKKKPVALAGVVDAIAGYHEPKTVEAVYDIGRYWMPKHKYPTLSAIRGLGSIRSGESIELLLKLYDQTFVRPGAGGALSGPNDAGGVTSGYTSDDTRARMSDYRPYILKSLRRLTGEIFGDDLEAWQDWWEDNQKTFDPASVGDDLNRTMDLTSTRYRYTIVRPNQHWKWQAKPDPGFDHTAVLEKDGRAVGRLSVLAYSTWAREPSNLGAMAAHMKKELERTISLVKEKSFDRKLKVGGADAVRHRVVGVRDDAVMTVEETMVLHRETMYLIELCTTRAVYGLDREDARSFVDSFRFLE